MRIVQPSDKNPWPACPDCGVRWPHPFDANDVDCECTWLCRACIAKRRRSAA